MTLSLMKKETSMTKVEKSQANFFLLRWMTINERPLSICDSDEFSQFCSNLNPNYKVSCYNTIKKYLCFYFEIGKANLKKIISKLDFYAITCDLWKSISKDNYLTIEIHFMTQDAVRQTKTLLCEAV